MRVTSYKLCSNSKFKNSFYFVELGHHDEPRTATGQCACGFGVKTHAWGKMRQAGVWAFFGHTDRSLPRAFPTKAREFSCYSQSCRVDFLRVTTGLETRPTNAQELPGSQCIRMCPTNLPPALQNKFPQTLAEPKAPGRFLQTREGNSFAA